MALMDFFKKDEKEEFDPLADLELSKLKVGFFLDYDMKTWEVTAWNKYDLDGDIVNEWELTSGREKWYLERAEDDDVEWTFSKKVPFGMLGSGVRQHIIDNEDPPEEITLKDTTYYLDESGPGQLYANGRGVPKPFVYWTFIDENDEKFVTIEQWGEEEFEAAAGTYVEEYQFTNILPAA